MGFRTKMGKRVFEVCLQIIGFSLKIFFRQELFEKLFLFDHELSYCNKSVSYKEKSEESKFNQDEALYLNYKLLIKF